MYCLSRRLKTCGMSPWLSNLFLPVLDSKPLSPKTHKPRIGHSISTTPLLGVACITTSNERAVKMLLLAIKPLYLLFLAYLPLPVRF